MGRGGRNHQQIGLFTKLDMGNMLGHIPQIGVDGTAGDRAKGDGGDKLPGSGRHHHVNQRPRLGQLRSQIHRFVNGNGTGNPQRNPLTYQQCHSYPLKAELFA